MRIWTKLKGFYYFLQEIFLTLLGLPEQYNLMLADRETRLFLEKNDRSNPAVLRIHLDAWNKKYKLWNPAVVVLEENDYEGLRINRTETSKWLFGEGERYDVYSLAAVCILFVALFPVSITITIAYSFLENRWQMSRESRAFLKALKKDKAFGPIMKRLLTAALKNEWKHRRR